MTQADDLVPLAEGDPTEFDHGSRCVRMSVCTCVCVYPCVCLRAFVCVMQVCIYCTYVCGGWTI